MPCRHPHPPPLPCQGRGDPRWHHVITTPKITLLFVKLQHHIGKQRVVLQNLVIRFSGDLDLKSTRRCRPRDRKKSVPKNRGRRRERGRSCSDQQNTHICPTYNPYQFLVETVEVLRIHLNAEGLSSLRIVERLRFAARALIKVRPIEVEGAGARTDLNGTVELRLRLR